MPGRQLAVAIAIATTAARGEDHGHPDPSFPWLRYYPAETKSAAVCNATLPFHSWDAGACLSGAEQGLWTIALNGTNTHEQAVYLCDGRSTPVGPLSCEMNAPGWSAPDVKLEGPQGSQTLVVFLGGTLSPPEQYSELLRAANAAGHYVIGLSHYSQPVFVSQVNAWCEAAPDPTGCNAELHELLLFGACSAHCGAGQGLWTLNGSQSVVSLLLASLQSTSWGSKFLISGGQAVDWTKVIISGHSAGGGHAAYLSLALDLPAVLFSAPQDTSAAWLSEMAAQTVPRRALFSAHEECGPSPLDPFLYCPHDLMRQNLIVMGMSEPIQTWSGRDSELTSNVVMSLATPTCMDLPRPYHRSVAMDACAPSNSSALWKRLFKFGNLDEPSGGDRMVSV